MTSAPVGVWLQAWRLCQRLRGEGVERMAWTPVGDREDLVMDMTLSIVEFFQRYGDLSRSDFWDKFLHSWLWRGAMRFARRAPYRVGDDPRQMRRCEIEEEDMEEVTTALWEAGTFDPENTTLLREAIASWKRRPSKRERDASIASCDRRF